MSTGEKTSPPLGGSEEGRSALRFLIVSAAAFCVDLVVALSISRLLHIPFWLATGFAYVMVSGAFYFVHERWTFAREGSRESAGRLAQTMASSAISLSGRIAVIYLLTSWHRPGMVGEAAYFWLGSMVSLGINYSLSRFWVFAAK
jgi:putative flippase GtrA